MGDEFKSTYKYTGDYLPTTLDLGTGISTNISYDNLFPAEKSRVDSVRSLSKVQNEVPLRPSTLSDITNLDNGLGISLASGGTFGKGVNGIGGTDLQQDLGGGFMSFLNDNAAGIGAISGLANALIGGWGTLMNKDQMKQNIAESKQRMAMNDEIMKEHKNFLSQFA